MAFKDKIIEKRNQIQGSLTHPKVVKFCIISASLVWVLGVLLAYLVAQLDPVGPGFDPAGYSFFINYISDLGSLRYTPMPVIINFTLMETSILMFPVSLYMKDVLKGDGSKKLRNVLANLTLICMIIALCGLFFVGVISEDVGIKLDAIFSFSYPSHDLPADFAFLFLMIGGVLAASQVIIFPEILKEQIGLRRVNTVRVLLAINSWILTPIFFAFFYTVPYLDAVNVAFWTYLPVWQLAPFWEWLLMISLSAWILVVSNILLVKHINRGLRSK